ncbi:MAG: UDP-N-acetylmuramoyl-L-alanyl-D-glutamate--2,6-diaminopimelate ligase [Candidatus Nealsonbacteria bacterium]
MKNLIKKFIPKFLLSWYHLTLAFLGALLYGFPSRKIKVMGVTGTNGKTTVVSLTTVILEEAGFKVASLSSVKFKIKDREKENNLKMTMPGRFKIQKFLREAVNEGCQYAVLEVSSEGIKQHRHRFIDFEAVLITNLAPEHIESHGSFGNYKKAKGRLFQATRKIHIVNIDDDNADYFLQFSANKKYTFGWEKGDVNTKNTEFKLSLIGKFNIYNALAAICVGLSQGISQEVCQKALEKAKGVPGRMEKVISSPFKVIVDYAVTPDALEKLYSTIKDLFVPSKLIAVLGACGGGRDKWKRPILGEIAARYCDEIIITNEDPYDEDPMEIINQVAKGVGVKARKTKDRREAIKEALSLAKENDVVVITGKGSEPWIIEANSKKVPWDEKKVVQEEYNKIKGKF